MLYSRVILSLQHESSRGAVFAAGARGARIFWRYRCILITCMYIYAGIHVHACYYNIVVAVAVAVVPRLALNARNLILSDALLQHVAMLLNRQNLAAPI